LTLRAFAAIEHQRLALAMNRERRDVALDGRARRGCTEEANAERHGGEYSRRLDCFLRRAPKGCWFVVAGRSIPAVNQQPATSRQQPINVMKNTIVPGAMYAFG
jgi:hypothetical protein